MHGFMIRRLMIQDNLLFSCCCARVDFSWTPVCDCYAGGYRCEQKCLEKALVEESVYATVGTVSDFHFPPGS